MLRELISPISPICPSSLCGDWDLVFACSLDRPVCCLCYRKQAMGNTDSKPAATKTTTSASSVTIEAKEPAGSSSIKISVPDQKTDPAPPQRLVTCVLIGAGNRGTVYRYSLDLTSLLCSHAESWALGLQ
jgi:hypothetical protein